MDRDQDIEVELYQENVGNLNYSTPTGSRSSSPDRFPQVLSSQGPTQRTQTREISPCGYRSAARS